jgi:hypothetical protein
MNAILAGIGFIGLFVLGVWLVGRDRPASREPHATMAAYPSRISKIACSGLSRPVSPGRGPDLSE